jgi:lantibiotic modifying enzyme
MERLPLWDDFFLKNFLQPQIKRIASVVSEQVENTKQPGWMTGLAGMAIFLGEYEAWKGSANGPSMKTILFLTLARIVDMINDGFTFPTHAAGLSGIVWAFRYLGKRGLIDKDDSQVLDELIPFIEKFAIHEIRSGNLDALHGGAGPYIVGVLNDPKEFESVFSKPNFNFRVPSGDIDLGLAHGLPSFLLLLSSPIARIQTGFSVEWNCFIRKSLKTLKSYANFSHKHSSIFPARIIGGIPQYPSRMAWCYGDVGIALALLRLADTFREIEELVGIEIVNHQLVSSSELFAFSERILIHAAKRRLSRETLVEDPYFCHGASGLAFMFYKAWSILKNNALQDAAKFWTLETINFLNSSHPIGEMSEKKGIQFGDGSLLNGLSGIGLSLIAIESGTIPGWEKGLLI